MTETIETTNPATGKVLAEYPIQSLSDIDREIERTGAAQRTWAALPVERRAELIGALGGVLRERADDLAALVTAEMGKPLGEARAEVEKCAWNCDFYAAEGAAFLEPEEIATAAASSYVTYEPLGVIFAVMPWNFPLWQLFRFAVPAMLAGNGVLLKHSPNVTGSAKAAEQACVDAGLPAGLLNVVVVDESRIAEVADHIIENPGIAGVTLTGSTRAGGHVAATAGRALKKSVLELGGSDPFIVLSDADVATAAVHAAKSRLMCTGQTCIAAKRIIVEESVADAFQKAFLETIASMPVGDPTDPQTQVGPLARPDLLETLERQVEESVEGGATLLCGGGRIDGEGNFFAPTVLTDVTDDMPVLREETFGPVAALVRVVDEDEAIKVANATEYGLAASVWSQDPDRALRVGRQVESGALFINSFVSSDPRLPFGGIKRSGFGRELGAAGLREFTNLRTVFVAK
ncbi:NAD-dependent succinate-semialdehyde dehydrogenase [Nocardioides sp. GXZ039]|uniref:NAD-dependent succinate-semialdehyde dehydrogenase n=1 Tax=Nocardioides sp. GXZ039 TaxID=3136018 RepID=UPI0030F423B3